MKRFGDKPQRKGQTPLLLESGRGGSGDAFAIAVAKLDQTTDLARPALALAADEYPGINQRRYLDLLDDLADEALQSTVAGAKSDCDAARRLAQFLVQSKGFSGNGDDFYDARNSYLCDVLDRRAGIPISLSLVLIEVGRRLGIPLVGIGFPGHFLVGCGPHRKDEYLLLDMFSGGTIVDWAECVHRLKAMGIEFDPEHHLSPVTNREFFIRMLGNLKAIYIQQRDVDRAVRTISRLNLLDTAFAADYTQLAETLAAEGSYTQARHCLRSFLDIQPDGDEAEIARTLLSHLLDLRAQRN